MIEEQSTYEELFEEQQFEEERKEYYDEYAVNPALAFPRPIVKTNTLILSLNCIWSYF